RTVVPENRRHGKTVTRFVTCLAGLIGLLTHADAPRAADPPIVSGGAKLEKLWSEGSLTEAPVCSPGGCAHFIDIGQSHHAFHPGQGQAHIFPGAERLSQRTFVERKKPAVKTAGFFCLQLAPHRPQLSCAYLSTYILPSLSTCGGPLSREI